MKTGTGVLFLVLWASFLFLWSSHPHHVTDFFSTIANSMPWPRLYSPPPSNCQGLQPAFPGAYCINVNKIAHKLLFEVFLKEDNLTVRERDDFLGIRKRLELCSGNFHCLSNCSLSKFRKLKMTLVIETPWSPKTRSVATDRKFKQRSKHGEEQERQIKGCPDFLLRSRLRF